jgi:hypothetical protein
MPKLLKFALSFLVEMAQRYNLALEYYFLLVCTKTAIFYTLLHCAHAVLRIG